jgi:iron uptake system component EfeO
LVRLSRCSFPTATHAHAFTRAQISGEEEAYSGLSLLIFYENYNGILSQYLPFHDHVRAVNMLVAQEAVEALDEAKMHLQAYHDSSVQYGVWTPYKDLDEYDRKTIYDNAMRVVMALEGAASALEIQFDAGGEEEEAGAVAVPEGFEDLVASSVAALQVLAEEMVGSATALLESIEAGDLSAARAAYETSRHEYEQIEVFANSFPQVDSDIDARPYSFDLGEVDEGFKGFHKIERALFRDHDLSLATEVATGLVESADQLVSALDDLSAFNVLLAFEGMIGLALEIAAKKISGEEETFSNLSVLIFEKNWEGISAVFSPYAESVTYGNLTSVLSTTAALERCLNVTAAIKSDTSIPPAFEGSATPSFNHLPSDTYLQDFVLASHGLATALVDVADDLGLFPDDHPLNKKLFPRTGF